MFLLICIWLTTWLLMPLLLLMCLGSEGHNNQYRRHPRYSHGGGRDPYGGNSGVIGRMDVACANLIEDLGYTPADTPSLRLARSHPPIPSAQQHQQQHRDHYYDQRDYDAPTQRSMTMSRRAVHWDENVRSHRGSGPPSGEYGRGADRYGDRGGGGWGRDRRGSDRGWPRDTYHENVNTQRSVRMNVTFPDDRGGGDRSHDRDRMRSVRRGSAFAAEDPTLSDEYSKSDRSKSRGHDDPPDVPIPVRPPPMRDSGPQRDNPKRH